MSGEAWVRERDVKNRWGGLPEHKPKRMRMKVRIERRAGDQREKRTPKIRWEVLRDMEKREEFERRTEELIEGVLQEGLGEEWKKITSVVM